MPVLVRARRCGRWTLGLVLAVTLGGCIGGQTGQPMSDNGGCQQPTREVPLDRATRGVVPLDAVMALEGAYSQPLVWVDDSGPLPNVPEDVLTLTFTYEGGVAKVDPCGSAGPFVDMQLDAVSRDHGPIGSGVARVTFNPPPVGASGELATFGSASGGFSAAGGFFETANGTIVSGLLDTSELGELRQGVFPPMPAR